MLNRCSQKLSYTRTRAFRMRTRQGYRSLHVQTCRSRRPQNRSLVHS